MQKDADRIKAENRKPFINHDNIRDEELAHARNARNALTELNEKLAAASLRLDAIRVISPR